MAFAGSTQGPAGLRAVVFLLAGIILLGAAVVTGRGAARFLQTSVTAPGVVTRLLAGPSHPEIRFSTPDGRSVTYPQGGLVGGYRPGQTVSVRYLAADPSGSASVDRWNAVWGVTLFLALLGCVFTLGGAASAMEALRR